MVTRDCILVLMALAFLAGCASLAKSPPDLAKNRKIQVERLPEFVPPKLEEGSLWSAIEGIALYPDRRASKVGDIVTVRIVEDPEAELNANTKTSRSSSLEGKLKFLGYMKALAERNRRLAQDPGEDDLIKANLGMNFDGKGSSDRDGHIKAFVPAIVVKVIPNGNLYIKGKRQIRVNNETQYITLSGIIRPEDIGQSNEISSIYVANAEITYSGIGPLADKQRPGWLGRIIDHVWPF